MQKPLIAGEALHKGFESQDQFVRRYCFDLALNSSGADQLTVLQRAFMEQDSHVRKAAVRKLHAILPNNSLKGLLTRARNDACMPVRREALHIYAEKYDYQAEQEFDANIGVREEAQYFFRKESALDLGTYYSQILNTSLGEHRLNATLVQDAEIPLIRNWFWFAYDFKS